VRDWKQYTISTLEELGLRARKQQGQNFLIRYRVVKQMVELAEILPSDHILEIGGGIGILTDALVETGARVTVIEKEKKLADHLQEIHKENDRVKIINEDALDADWPTDCRIVANLPYSVASPIIEKILHRNIGNAMIMIQKEVAMRCIANPGSRDYSRISVLCKIHGSVKRMMDLAPDSFFPKPKVNSTVISIWTHEPKITNSHEDLELLVSNLFTLRRRTVRSVIRGFLKRKTVDPDVWEICPHSDLRVFELSIKKIDEILTHLKNYNAFPLA
jgi:16S rRNA (adenine1518-N6/adenine1519-N6)-dimethyltransferase